MRTYDSQVTWRKSSQSNQQGGNCVELAEAGLQVLVRDSKDPEGGVLAFGAEAWTAFATTLRAGAYDLPT